MKFLVLVGSLLLGSCTGTATSTEEPQPDAGTPGVPSNGISGRQLYIDGAPLQLRGVCWSPVAKGRRPPADFTSFATQDIALMKAAGINAVRTYDVITDRTVLDRLKAAGIWVLPTVYSYGGDPEARAVERVNALKDHPAILMWLLGNEWNYNGLYTDVPFAQARDRLQRIAAAIHAADPSRPVATVYGEVPSAETIAAMPAIDLWGLNVYRGIGFGDLFNRWASLSGKPMFLSEYGADAWDARNGGRENAAAQAEATTALTQALVAKHSIALGGTIFAWSDEWWKAPGSPSLQETGGSAPGGGPYPDQTFNEEWWGLVDVDRKPRAAYEALKAIYAP
jgi:exo-beta-1,3-glucanase (GH17 family)